MKNTIYILLLAIFAIACSDSFLEETPKGSLTTEGFGQTKEELDLAINALYKAFSDIGYSEETTALWAGSDDITTRAGSNKENLRDFDMFFASKDANTNVQGVWEYLYNMVNTSNFIINNYELAISATEEERNFAAGQAYCIRGYAYYMLTRFFKDVPLITDNAINKDINKSSPNEIYALVIEDLKKAETLLPNTWSGLLEGKGVTAGAAKSLLASVYLSMTGYPVKDESKYTLAAQKAKEVIDNANIYGYRLLNDYQELWLDIQTHDELILGTFYNPSTDDPTFRAPSMGKPQEEGGWDEYFSEINFFYSFPEGSRKDATFITTMNPSEGVFYDWTKSVQKHPYYKKYLYANGKGPDNYIAYEWNGFNSTRTTQLMRYAEVKLIYAEAQTMSSSPDATAYKEINDVRNRAGLPDLTPGLSQIQFRDAVIDERAWEFAGPENGQRWFDLVRLEMVESANTNRHANELPLQRTPSKDDYFAPIPLQERLINPNLN